ncbi:MAG TPA: dihydrofolate reductase family protein [Humisphaera sp.]
MRVAKMPAVAGLSRMRPVERVAILGRLTTRRSLTCGYGTRREPILPPMNASPAETDAEFLRRAIRLAMNGRGRVEPNPMVGCVLVRDGQIIGEGYHTHFGGPHAEPTALADCAARGNSPEGATAYVTLEPCCHTNKKTPPCAPRLIAAKVARVVIGCLDPNPAVNGNGVAMLRAAGIEVDHLVNDEDGSPLDVPEAAQLIAPFFSRNPRPGYRSGQWRWLDGKWGLQDAWPYVTLKWAESADRKIAGPYGSRLQISNATSSRLVHLLRARSDAILVGIQTVLKDDPMLTARDVPDPRPLRRCVLDPRLEIPLDAKLVTTSADRPVTVYCGQQAPRERPEHVATLKGYGVELVPVSGHERHLDLQEVFASLGEKGATHVLVESGGRLAASLLSGEQRGYGRRGKSADRVWVFRSPRRVGDELAPGATPVPGRLRQVGRLKLDGDELTEYLNPESGAFYAAVPSADFVLAAEAAGDTHAGV